MFSPYRALLAVIISIVTGTLMSDFGVPQTTSGLAVVLVWLICMFVELQVDRIINALGKEK